MFRVEVVEYDPVWPHEFEREVVKIRQALGENVVAIHHIGSTSVPGLMAKPIIDILPVVAEIEEVDSHNHAMEQLGYEPMGEFGIPGRRYFRKGSDPRTHHVHVFAKDDANVARHVAFRDYLRTHPQEAEIYGALKSELAAQFPTDIDAYMKGKDALVKALERKALVGDSG